MKNQLVLNKLAMPFIFLLWLVISPPAIAFAPISSPALPESCQTNCTTLYGKLLGTAGKVPAYSNCKSSCVISTPNQEQGIYTGIKWQCVEFARRWLLINQGLIYGDVEVAADLWNKITVLTRVSDKKEFPLRAIVNGSPEPPQPGDLLIYSREFLGTGHVAVVSEVNLAQGIVQVVEQNFLNQPWSTNYARQLELIEKEQKYWLLDAYLLGWKRLIR